MLSYKQYVFEKRKNPKLNPKQSVLDKLYDYTMKGDYFVSFRNINKLGINPSSKYDTPNAIYAYRLNDYQQKLETANKIKAIFPFTGDKPAEYAYVFDYKEDANVIELGDMERNEVIGYIQKWFELYPSTFNKFIDQESLNKHKRTIEKYTKIINWIDKLKNVDDFDELVKSVKDEIDPLDDLIPMLFNKHELEMNQHEAVVIKTTIKNYLEKLLYDKELTLSNMQDALEDVAINYDDVIRWSKEKLKMFPDLDSEGKEYEMAEWVYANRDQLPEIEEPRIDSYGGIFWWFGWVMYGETPNKWNAFFRKLGIDGVIDEECEGIIHPNEPCQAAFFNKTKLDVIEAIPNKEYKMGIEDYRIKTPEGVEPVRPTLYKYYDKENPNYRFMRDATLDKLENLIEEEPDDVEHVKQHINQFVIPMLKDEDNPDFVFKLVS